MRFKNFLDSLDIYLLENLDIVNEGVYDPGIFKAVFLAGGPGCFTEDTLVYTKNGYKKISECKKDDVVYNLDKDKNLKEDVIDDKYVHDYEDMLIEIILFNGEKFICTPYHKLRLENGNWKYAIDINENDKLMDSENFCEIKKINKINKGFIKVYDLKIKNDHNYFVTKSNINVHNSGKSFVAQKSTSGMGLKMINSDTLFEILGKKSGINLKQMPDSEEEARNKVRDKAKDLTNKQLLRFINGRLGLIIDGTGRDFKKIEKQRNVLKLLGYDTYMVFVNTSLDVALERNQQRSRSVSEKIVTKAWKNVQENMGKFQNLFGSKNFRIVDNNTYVSDKEIFSDVWKDVMKFVKVPISNPIAKVWIEQAKKKKKEKKELDIKDTLL